MTGGQVHDTRQVSALISRGAIRRIGRGRPRLRPTKLVGDKAYSSRSIRLALRKRGIIPVIPTKANERRQPDFDREAYRQRNIIERLINRLKNFRRIATRSRSAPQLSRHDYHRSHSSMDLDFADTP